MPVFNRRVKMVSFRLSDEEYGQAIQTCSSQGIRSVSALARAATVKLLDEAPAAAPPAPSQYSTSAQLEQQLRGLTEALARVSLLLDVRTTNAANHHHSDTNNTETSTAHA